jgi:pyridoxal phosphate enzyme, YggS family
MFDCDKLKQIEKYISQTNSISKIIAISKNHPKESVFKAIDCGIRDFGENRVQEASIKFADLLIKYPEISLHLTGPLQTNKVKDALKIFSFFHTLDREKLAREFSKHASIIKFKKFFIQVNTGREESKSGVLPENLKDLFLLCKNDLKLNIIGLMCIPPISDDPNFHFKLLKDMGEELKLNKFSMGMSADYKVAIDLNSNYIRLGTILFGKRL